MNRDWHWFRGTSGRIVVVHCRSDAPAGSTWKMLPMSRTGPDIYLAVVFTGAQVAPHTGREDPDGSWTLEATAPMVLRSPDGDLHREIVPASAKSLMRSRVTRMSGVVGLILVLLAWFGPWAIRPILDRPVPLHERLSEGRIVLDRNASPEDRAIWTRGPGGWFRKTLEIDKITGKAGNPSRGGAKKRARPLRETDRESH